MGCITSVPSQPEYNAINKNKDCKYPDNISIDTKQYKYQICGRFQCPSTDCDTHTHSIKRSIDIFYDFVRGSVQSNHTKLIIGQSVPSEFNTILKKSKYTCKGLNTDLYINIIPVTKHNTLFNEIRDHNIRCNDEILIIYDILNINDLLPIIIPRFIIGKIRCRKDDSIPALSYFEFDYDTHVPNFYIYDYYHHVVIKEGDKNNMICNKCHIFICDSCGRYCWELHMHGISHCCVCRTVYNKGLNHCCACKISYPHKYHCCKCKRGYDKFNVGCTSCNDAVCTTCVICCKENLDPKMHFRTVCNKSLICSECCVAIQRSGLPSCPFCKNTDIKAHILFD